MLQSIRKKERRTTPKNQKGKYMYFISDHPVLTAILSIVLIIVIIVMMVFGIPTIKNLIFNGNRQVFDTKLGFHWAIIELGNGELIEGAVKAWNDYSESDCVQIIMEDGNVILTHYSRVLLCAEKP